MDHPLMAEVETALHRVLATDSPSLGEIVSYFLRTGGKGTRPLLVLLCGDIVSAPAKRSVDLAVAVELLHMASLVHDDIVDKAPVRRQQASIHSLWGEGAAVLVGDYFFGKMLGMISSYPPVIPAFADAVQSLVAGEFLQADQQSNPFVTEEEYLERIRHKTANFISVCCKINCLADDTPLYVEKTLAGYGYYLGMAYQLADDLIDVAESPERIGKPVMQDISRGIFTLPYLYEFRRMPPAPGCRYGKIPLSRESLAYTKRLAAHYIQKSVNCLSALPRSKAKTGLIRIALRLKKMMEQLQEANLHAPSVD